MIDVVHIRDSSGIFGAERVILTIAKNIKHSDFKMRLICMRRGDGKSQHLINIARKIGVEVFPVNVKGKLDFRAIIEIRKYLKKKPANIIHSHDFKSDLYALLSTLFTPCKRVATAHGSTRDSLVKKIYLFFTENIIYRFFDQIIAVSKELEKFLLSIKLNPKRIITISNGIDFSLIGLENSTKIDKLIDMTKGKKVFSVIGRIYPDKGHIYFCEAFNKTIEKHPDSVGLIVGDGPNAENIADIIKKMGLSKKIILCGVQKNIHAIYRLSDCIVIPSLREGLPYVLLEAMACKIPVVATRVGDIPRLIKHGETGFLSEPANSCMLAEQMISVLEKAENVSGVVDRGFALVEDKYSARGMVNKVESLYKLLNSY